MFALLIGGADAQTQQTSQQLFPIAAATPGMRANPAVMQMLEDFNRETLKLRVRYDSLEEAMNVMDFEKESRHMKREFIKRNNLMVASVDASMEQLTKQRELDNLKAQGPNRNIQGGTQNAMNNRYGVDPSVLTDEEYQAQQKEDLEMVHNDIYKKDIALDSKRYDRDMKTEDVAIESANSQIENQQTLQAHQKTKQSDEELAQASNSVETGINSLKAGIIPTAAEAKGETGYTRAVHKAGVLSKEQMKSEVAKERQERKRVQDERQNDRKTANVNRKIKKKEHIWEGKAEARAVREERRQATYTARQQNNPNQQQPVYYQDNRTPTERQYGLSGLGGQPCNGPVIAPPAVRRY